MILRRKRHKIVTIVDLIINKTTTYPTAPTMKFSVFAIAALAVATTSSRCMVAAAAAARNRKIQKKTSSSSGVPNSAAYVIPIGGDCLDHRDNCAIPFGLQHGVCYCNYPCEACGLLCECQSGQPDARCDQTSDCVVPPELEHAVCRYQKCQSGQPGALCGATSDCVVPPGLDHAVCRQGKCQRGVCWDYCGQDSDCISPLQCVGVTNIAKCQYLSEIGSNSTCPIN